MKFHILIYGCQMNYSDSARIKAILENCGFFYVSKTEDADIVIFDTCSVRQKSEDKIWGILKQIPKNKKIWITGCMIQHQLKLDTQILNSKKGNFIGNVENSNNIEIIGFKKIFEENTKKMLNTKLYINYAFDPIFNKMKKEFSNLELFFRINDIGFLPLILEKLGYKIKYDKEIINEYTGIIPNGSNIKLDKLTKTAFVPIQTGCSQFCAYCIVPFARGLEKNRSFDDIINEINFHILNGVEEIILLGQIVNKHPDFKKILNHTLKIKGLKRLRYTSPYPTYFDDEILSMHQNEEKLCPHIHLPVQSGSDKILKKMFRGYNIKQYKDFINKIKNLKRDISITTDIIVGFSDESQKDFMQTIDLINYVKFDMIYIGIYSPRIGTYAFKKYEDNIDIKIKKQRWQAVNDLVLKYSLENNQKEIGKITDIMITDIKEKKIIGYDEKMKNVIIDKNIKTKNIKIGKFIKTKIIKAESLKLIGKSVK